MKLSQRESAAVRAKLAGDIEYSLAMFAFAVSSYGAGTDARELISHQTPEFGIITAVPLLASYLLFRRAQNNYERVTKLRSDDPDTQLFRWSLKSLPKVRR